MSKKNTEEIKPKNNPVKAALESNTIKLVNSWRIADAELMINLFQTQSNSRFAVCKKYLENEKPKFSQWILEKEQLLPKLSNVISEDDTYFSINSVQGVRRRVKDLFRLNGFIIDLDYYKCAALKGKTPEDVIAFLREKGFFDKIEPSFFIYSGNGMYIAYLIKNASPACLGLWKRIMQELFTMFAPYGADPRSRDAVHVFRLCGTRNSKTGNLCKFIFNSNQEFRFEQEKEPVRRYTLAYMAEILLPELPYTKEEWLKIKAEKKAAREARAAEKKAKKEAQAKIKKQMNTTNKVIHLKNLYTLNFNRMLDLETLVTIRNGYCRKNGVTDIEGNREYILFLYRYCNLLCFRDVDKSLKDTLQLNKKFVQPMDTDEVIQATSNVIEQYKSWQKAYTMYNEMPEAERPNKIGTFFHKYCYTFKNSTIIQELEITAEEMQSMNTIKVLSKAEHNAKYKAYRAGYMRNSRRNADGLTNREQAKIEKINSIKALLEQGKKQKEIVEILGISKGMVSRYVKEIAEIVLEEEIILQIAA